MNTTLDKISHKAQRAAASVIIDKVLAMVDKDREKGFLELVDWAEQFWGNGFSKEDYDKVRTAIKDPDNRWIKFINRVLDETDPHVAKMAALNLGFEAFFRGTKMIRKNREIYHCNIPWLILFDPTSACNMHCQGCWSGTYGHKANLSFDDMDKIITEGKELGVYLYMMTGGEPLVRKADILRLAEKHNDVELSIYTNSTLIDEDFCKEVVRLGNITFQLSIEGTPETNDARRGDGHYAAVMKAMDLLKKYGIIFGTSICYTSKNYKVVTSDEFLQMLVDKGAILSWFFHYMPVGKDASTDLLLTPEQREYMVERVRFVRSRKCPIKLFTLDFQNDAEFVGGCIAGGKNYLHINPNGDVEPCVFIHYSNINIKEHSLLECLQQPLFMQYHDNMPFNDNQLRPCPMLENPEMIKKMVEASGAHSTDMQAEEPVDSLIAKTIPYAENWKPVADRLWKERQDEVAEARKERFEKYGE